MTNVNVLGLESTPHLGNLFSGGARQGCGWLMSKRTRKSISPGPARFQYKAAATLGSMVLAWMFLHQVVAAKSNEPPGPDRANSAARSADSASTPDLAGQPTLYIVGYAHLDTEWRWEYPQVIQEYLSKTLRNNFELFEKYPHYIFNFTGANRFMMFKEYYPADYERLKLYAYSYLFAYEIDLPQGAARVTLPDNPHIRILAATWQTRRKK